LANRPLITLTTDFGLNDHFVGTIKGVILDIAPEAEIIDICHAVQAFDILDGALAIAQAYSYFPNGTIHLVVVDPGVGTARRPILLSTGRHYFVAPDNGVLSLIYNHAERIEVRHIVAEHYYRQPVSSTFHARDVFAPVVAYLAKGVETAKFGEVITDFVRFNAPRPKPIDAQTLRGVVLRVDRSETSSRTSPRRTFPRCSRLTRRRSRFVLVNTKSRRFTATTPEARRMKSSGSSVAWAI
jgi:S-adenosyl-L-methionine hydrolase (adenosine-forming)